MTSCVEASNRRWLAFGLCLALAAAGHAAAPAGTNVPAAAVLQAAASNDLPAWMELSALATNTAEWADLADTWRRGPEAEASPTENFTVPIEHYDNGRIRAILRAGKGALGRGGVVIWSWKVAVELLDPAGAPDGRIEAESCLYDRTARRGYCPAGVTLVRTNVTISGTGLYWTMNPQRMQILSNPVVRLQQGVRISGAGIGRTNATLRSEKVLRQDAIAPGGATK